MIIILWTYHFLCWVINKDAISLKAVELDADDGQFVSTALTWLYKLHQYILRKKNSEILTWNCSDRWLHANCGNSTADKLELIQSCTKPLTQTTEMWLIIRLNWSSFVHPFVQPSLCIMHPSHIHKSIDPSIHSSIHPPIHPYIHTSIQPNIHI